MLWALGNGALGLWDGRMVLRGDTSFTTHLLHTFTSQSLALQFLYLCLDVLELGFFCFFFLAAWGPSCSTRDLLIAVRVL